MFARLYLIFFSMFVSSAALVSAAPVTTFYATTDSSQFGIVNPVTGAFTLIGTESSTLYGLVNGPSGLIGLTATGELVSINVTTGALTNIGSTGTTPSTMGQIGSTVYIMDTNQTLYTVNTSNGNAIPVGSTGIPAVTPANLVTANFDSSLQGVGGNLYYTFDQPGTNPELYLINPATAFTTTVGSTLAGLNAALLVNGTDYVFQSLGSSQTTSAEYALNLSTGATSFLVNVSSNATELYGIAQTPEPASITLAGLGMAICAFRFLRQREKGKN